MDTKKAKYIALDLETTGLDPATCYIIEVAAVVLNNALEEKGRYQYHVEFPMYAPMDKKVRDMHLGTKLLMKCGSGFMHYDNLGAVSLGEAEENLILIKKCHFDLEEKPTLLGASIDFDRKFLKHWMPTFESLLHYRMVDSSITKSLAPDVNWPKTQGTKHRAMDDALESVERIRLVRNALLQ